MTAARVALTEEERESLDQSLADSGCHGWPGDHPDLYAAVERIIAQRTQAARAEALDEAAEGIEADMRTHWGNGGNLRAWWVLRELRARAEEVRRG